MSARTAPRKVAPKQATASKTANREAPSPPAGVRYPCSYDFDFAPPAIDPGTRQATKAAARKTAERAELSSRKTAFPMLQAGALVRTDVTLYRFHAMRVVRDSGPAGDGRRAVTLQNANPGCAWDEISVRRDRVRPSEPK